MGVASSSFDDAREEAVASRMTPGRAGSVREAVVVFGGQLLAVFGTIASVRVLTELIPPAVYGELALALTATVLLNQTVFGPLSNGAMRFYASAVEKDSLPAFLAATWRLTQFGIAVTAALFVAAAIGLVALGRGTWSLLVLAVLLYTVATGINAILTGIQNAARQRAVVALHQSLDPWVKVLVTATLLVTFGVSSSIAMLGFAVAAGLVLGSQYLFYRRLVGRSQQHASVEGTWRREIWRYTLPFVTWGIFTWCQLASDRWAIDWFGSRADVGRFGVLYQFGYAPIQLATGIVVQFIAPILFQRAGDAIDPERNNDISRMSRTLTAIVLGLTGLAFVVSLVLHAPLFKIFVARDYAGISYLLPWVVLGGGIFAAAQTVSLKLMSQLRASAMITAKIATALLGIVLNLIGARLYGTAGVVAASIIFSLACLVWMLALARESAEPNALRGVTATLHTNQTVSPGEGSGLSG